MIPRRSNSSAAIWTITISRNSSSASTAGPFAYLQCYRIGEWHDGFGPQPAGTRGLDQFIGEADMLGRGHGSAFVRAFIEKLFARGVPRIVIDPRPDNPARHPRL